MHIIKLDAIGSTNDFLKEMTRAGNVSDYTVVTAENQTSGRGQRGADWLSETGKNLTVSVFVRVAVCDAGQIFILNAAVALSVLKAMQAFGIPDLRIKWPNDILSGNLKIGGILIENHVKSATIVESVIGVGLNVNQSSFGELPKAGSMFTRTGLQYDRDEVLAALLHHLQHGIERLKLMPDTVWEEYSESLFKKGVPTVFSDSGRQFMGIITEATKRGTIKILLEDDSVKEYGIKEVQMHY